MGRPTRLLGETMKMMESSLDVEANLAKSAPPTPAAAKPTTAQPAPESAPAPSANGSSNGKKYTAWLPPDEDKPS
jgi:hypothetical protein